MLSRRPRRSRWPSPCASLTSVQLRTEMTGIPAKLESGYYDILLLDLQGVYLGRAESVTDDPPLNAEGKYDEAGRLIRLRLRLRLGNRLRRRGRALPLPGLRLYRRRGRHRPLVMLAQPPRKHMTTAHSAAELPDVA